MTEKNTFTLATVGLLLVIAVQPVLPQRFRAFSVASGLPHAITDPKSLKYVACDVEMGFKLDQFYLGPQSYTIYNREKVQDSMDVYFCYRDPTHPVYISVTILPIEGLNNWRVFIVWPDSSKAFQTRAVK